MSTSGRVVGGLHPVRELLRSSQPVDRILVAASRDRSAVVDDILSLAGEQGVEIERVQREALDRRADGLVHQGVLAFTAAFPYVRLEDLILRLDAARDDGPPFLVALDGVTDPHNLGSIARTAEAVGAAGLVLPSRRAAPVTPTVEKAAAGALAHLPVVQVSNLVGALGQLSDHGIWSLGLDGDAEVDLAEHPLVTEPCVLVVGAEGAGLARLVRDRCDVLVRLPMRGRVGSLNASVAAGVALYELFRRRR